MRKRSGSVCNGRREKKNVREEKGSRLLETETNRDQMKANRNKWDWITLLLQDVINPYSTAHDL